MKYFKICTPVTGFNTLVIKNMFFRVLSICMMFSCNTKQEDNTIAENAFDAGREFIDATLKGDFNKAAFYIKNDATNKQILQRQENEYAGFDAVIKEEYRQASIIINQDSTINDTVHIISYANSYDKKNKTLKVVFTNNTWMVDLK